MTAMTHGDDLASILTETLQQLTAVIARENTALQSGHTDKLKESQKEKERLAHQYESQLQALKRRKATQQWSPSPALLQQLQQTGDQFHQVLSQHRRLVQAAKSVGERMLAAITKDVAARQSGFSVYGQEHSGAAISAYARKPVSVALNQTV